ncbi:T9SS type B sorting domain-containing protein [Niastella caeni]|uniref:T9SS type B sorting domain-containing protein n=1 Tax=Niastella caeni TaxID=2569763 RepID=A0A4S8HWR2_9BACT|nr:gliding motility-associated C-terminal domain-containing protein [Niastella caeni]THU39189.1 T9SS type B sorting domain-containing protein [Niastella caeni]
MYKLIPLLIVCVFIFSQPVAFSQIGGTINDYAPVIQSHLCNNTLEVTDASRFNTGDTVLLIQMKGAVIDSSNTASFGTITDYRNAGNYEYNFIAAKTGNLITLKNALLRKYDIPAGKVQLVRVPSYNNVTVTSTLTCKPWDGASGGVLAFTVQNALTLQADIDVSNNGFRRTYPLNSRSFTCNETQWYYPGNTNQGGEKGEGIHALSASKNFGRGAPSNGGGGGNGHNAGGGGGSNAGGGGNGGQQWEGCGNTTEFVGGRGGKPLQNSAALNKLFMGGSGGMGNGNDLMEFPSGSGGGIIIIRANSLAGNSHFIKANGENAYACSGGLCVDGMSGGGAGGTIVTDIQTITNAVTVEVKGGNGADHVSINNRRHGSGGGGGGGFIALPQAVTWPLYNVAISGGMNGVNTNNGNDAYGSTPGINGIVINSFAIAQSTVPFKKNIDSVRIQDSLINCREHGFGGFGFVNTNPVSNWQWFFGDNTTAGTQNTTHSYATAANYIVKLKIWDINQCTDSISKTITIQPGPIVTISNDTSVCATPVASIPLHATGGTTYSWSPVTGLNDPAVANPVATLTKNQVYKVIVTNDSKCSVEDSVAISLYAPAFKVSANQSICSGQQIQLRASGGDEYTWSPAALMSDALAAEPFTAPDATTTYSVYIKDNACSVDTTMTTRIVVNPLPVIVAQKSNDVNCNLPTARLTATGAVSYTWSPVELLNYPAVANPEVSIDSTTLFVVKGTNQYGCSSTATVTVNLSKDGVPRFVVPNAFTPNGDGKNDCFGIRRWGNATIVQFSVYNRWGQMVFETNNTARCWDGTLNGKPLAAGGYAYVIRAATICGFVTQKGMVTLLR